MNKVNSIKILRLRDVQESLQLSRSTIYEMINPKSPRYSEDFPKPIKLGSNAVGWLEEEIYEWLQTKMAQR